jgi:hypothetical protein
MQQRLKVLTEETLLPFGVVIILFGGISWLTSLYNETKANAMGIQDLKLDQRSYGDKLDRIIQKLSKIEGKLGLDSR